MRCTVHTKSDKPEDQVIISQYYQWVTFVFAIQAAVFYLPYKIWSCLEGGLMASFGTDAKNKIMVSRDSELGETSLVLEAISDRFVKYFKCVFHRNSWYFINFCACKSRLQDDHYDLVPCPGELLNFILLVIQFDMTDRFLSGKFRWYGWDVVSYLRYCNV